MDDLAFTKAHGTGNDFVVVADLADDLELSAGLVRALCDRRTGIGADGVIRIGAGGDGADVFMDYRNADGSIVEMCGNGVRVVAKHVVDHGLVEVAPGRGPIHVAIGTRAGIRTVQARRGADGNVNDVTVDMGVAVFDPAAVPFLTDREPGPDGFAVDVAGTTVVMNVVSMGNPHAVIMVDGVADAPVNSLGSALQQHPQFPQAVNVGFVERRDGHTIRLRVHERGVGETQACGTGACAAVAVLQHRGILDDQATVEVLGGVLAVDRHEDGRLLMTGPAVEVAYGTVTSAWLQAATSQEGCRQADADG